MINQDGLPSGEHKGALIARLDELIAFIGDRPLDAALEAGLNDRYGAHTKEFSEIERLLRVGIEENWACYVEIDGPNYRRGRIGVGQDGVHDFVIESARLSNVRGNYHRHPRGEINMIQPLDPESRFCDAGRGWKVFPPDTSHYPTVTGGTCTFIFLLPKGEIEYHTDH